MDDLGPIEIEFVINNPEVIAQANQVEATLQDVTDSATAQAKQGAAAVATLLKTNEQAIKASAIASINELQTQYATFTALAQGSTSIDKINLYNQKAEAALTSIKSLSNAGKAGFDELGNAIPVEKVSKFEAAVTRATTAGNLGARVVNSLSRQFVTLAAGILGSIVGVAAIEGLIAYIEKLDALNDKLNETRQTVAYTNQALQSSDYTKAISSISELTENIQLAKDGFLNKTEVLNEYNKELGSSLGYTDDLNKAEALLVSKGQAFIQLTLLKATAQLALAEATKKQLDIAKIQMSNTNVNDANNDKNDQTGFENLTFWERLVSAFSQNDNTTQALLEQGKTRALKTATDEKNGLLKIFDDLQKQAAELAKNTKIDFFGGKENTPDPFAAQAQTLLASQTTLQQNIQALKDKYASKDKTRDEQALDDLKATFQKEYDAIVAYDKKRQDLIDNYNRAHKNSGGEAYVNKKGLTYIDPNQLKSVETGAEAGLAGQQSLEDTKNQVAQQKVIFQQYQDFKLKAGTDAANQLYGNELKGFATYYDYLKSLEPTEAELGSADPYVKARATAMADYLKTILPAALNADLAANKKHLQDLIVTDQNFIQKRQTLIEKAQDDIKALTAAGKTEQVQIVKDNLNAQLTQIEVSGFEQQAAYKDIYTNITQLSTDAAKQQIKSAEAVAEGLYLAGLLSDEAFTKISNDLKKLDGAIDDKDVAKIGAIGAALTQLGQTFTSSGAGIGTYISDLGNMANGLASVGKQLAQFKKDAGDSTAQFNDEVGLVETGLNQIVNIIGNIASASAQRKQFAEDYYNSVIAFQAQYNIALEEQQRIQYQTDSGSIFGVDSAKELSDAAIAYKEASSNLSDAEAKLSAGQAIVGTHNAVSGSNVAKDAGAGATAGAAIGAIAGVGVLSVPAAAVGAIVGGLIGGAIGLFAGKKKVDTLAPLLDTYPQLIDANGKFNESLAKTLIANNQVDAATKVLLNNTIAYYDEQQAAIDQITSALKDLVGDLGSDISNSLVSAFENGSDAAKAFGDTVAGVLDNIIQQDLFEAVFGQQLQTLQDKLTADSLDNDGNTSAELIADVVAFYKNAGALVPEFEDGLKAAKTAGAASGLSLFPDPNAPTTPATTTLAGQISGITADQANILEGSIRGMQLAVVEANGIATANGAILGSQLSEMKNQTLIQMAIQVNTGRTADNTDVMKVSLQNIDSNTSAANLTNAVRAAGH